MNFLRLFYPKRSVKRKILGIKGEIQKITSQYCNEEFWIHWYGAYKIDPKNLVFWICVTSDLMKQNLVSNPQLMIRLRALLVKYDYPENARQSVAIDFESQETVDRESNGSWYVHFK